MSYVRVSILGAAPGGEVWSINPVFDPTGEFGTTVNQAALDAACDAITAISPGSGLLSLMSTALTITGARVEVREDAGDELMAISIQPRATPLAGTGVPVRGSSAALVFSLRTDTPGASGRGRLYWPNVASAITTQLRMQVTDVTSAMNAMATYLHAIESALATAFPTIGFDLAVRSKVQQASHHVNKLQVGNVIDTQRRRRDKMIEDYQSVAF